MILESFVNNIDLHDLEASKTITKKSDSVGIIMDIYCISSI